MAAENSESPTPDGTAPTMIQLLQEINKNLIENLKQQNKRITEIETKLASASTSDVQKSTPAPILPEMAVEDAVPRAAKDDHEDDADQGIESDSPSASNSATSLAKTPVATSSSSKHYYDWLEPPDTPGSVFATFPKVKTWCRKHLWIPSDGRIRLVFDIPTIDTSRHPKTAKNIYSGLQDVSNGLVKNGGRLLIVDNDCYGSNRKFGNLTWIGSIRRRRLGKNPWSTKLSAEICPGSESGAVIPLKVPMIDSRKSSPPHQWRRLILLEGLAEMISKDLEEPCLNISDKFFPRHKFVLDHTVERYLRDGQWYSGGSEIEIKYSWFTLSQERTVRKYLRPPKPENCRSQRQDYPGLRAGILDEDELSRWLGNNTSLFGCVAESSLSKKSTTDPYYTMVVAKSPGMGVFIFPRFDAQVCILEHDVQVLEQIGVSTDDILDYIDKILDIRDDILLDPRKHDQLLFDDDSFSRSRKYWWASNLLVVLRQKIEDSRKLHQQLVDDLIVPIIGIATDPKVSRDTSTWPNGLAEVEDRAAKAYGRLGKLLDRIDVQQKRVDALRDGLFNASGVMESRASRRLSEIVKLLTYVSIFYLPLTFSTSLWSTTDTFHNLDTAMLFVVMIIIGGLTYTLVLNLEHVAQSTYAYYKRLRNQVIKPMKEDTAETWKDRAKKYEAFQFLPTDAKLSEWWVLWYIILWSFRALIRKTSLVRTEAQNPLRWLRHKPKHLDNASPPVNDASDTEDDDWMETYPKDPNEVEISISTSPNPIHEKISTPTEKATTLIESPSAPAEGGEATSSHTSQNNKRNSWWLSFRSIFTKSTQNGGDIEGERV